MCLYLNIGRIIKMKQILIIGNVFIFKYRKNHQNETNETNLNNW